MFPGARYILIIRWHMLLLLLSAFWASPCYRWLWLSLPWWRSKHSPRVQMRTRCSPAVFHAAVEQVQHAGLLWWSLKPRSSSILCACAGTNTLAALDSSQKIAFFFFHLFCTVEAIISILCPSLLRLCSAFRGCVGKKWAALSLQQQWKISSEFIRGKISILWDHLTLILEGITSLTVTPAATSALFFS